jgi:hypothetical protein
MASVSQRSPRARLSSRNRGLAALGRSLTLRRSLVSGVRTISLRASRERSAAARFEERMLSSVASTEGFAVAVNHTQHQQPRPGPIVRIGFTVDHENSESQSAIMRS